MKNVNVMRKHTRAVLYKLYLQSEARLIGQALNENRMHLIFSSRPHEAVVLLKHCVSKKLGKWKVVCYRDTGLCSLSSVSVQP